mmetsp:Transcript_81947/g.171477  ORF Transcript_81947/g.171477 Transcript_81947/m.171477 type:complete len:219 (+) Transcript_81947:1826-2482(+)
MRAERWIFVHRGWSEGSNAPSFLPFFFLPEALLPPPLGSFSRWCRRVGSRFIIDHSMTSEKIFSSSMTKKLLECLPSCMTGTCLFWLGLCLGFMIPRALSRNRVFSFPLVFAAACGSSSSPFSSCGMPRSGALMERTAKWKTFKAALQAVNDSFACEWMRSSLSFVRTLALPVGTSGPSSSSSAFSSSPCSPACDPSSSSSSGSWKSRRDLSCSMRNL